MQRDLGTIKIIITKPNLIYFINLDDNNVTLSMQPKFSVDTVISGPSKAFVLLLLTKQYNLAFNTGLEVTGNLNLAEKLQKILFKSDIDWQTKLETVFDPAIAYQIQQFGAFAKANLTDFKISLMFSLTDYLLYENKVLVSKEIMNEYIQEIDNLRFAIDRIEARINNLIARQLV
jgi:ubiquinone biosynthesis accessory factor UbiJ